MVTVHPRSNGLSRDLVAVDLWWVALDDPETGGVAVLSREERARAARFRDPVDARRFERRRAALRRILGWYVGRAPGDLGFDRSCLHCGDAGHGKPVLTGVPGAIHFSASSTAGVAVVAVSRSVELGVDVEVVPPGAEEVLALDRRRWTRYEALVKGIGVGVVGFGDPEDPFARAVPGWATVEVSRPGLVGALAVRSAPFTLFAHTFSGRCPAGPVPTGRA